jgi:hypothetical protein
VIHEDFAEALNKPSAIFISGNFQKGLYFIHRKFYGLSPNFNYESPNIKNNVQVSPNLIKKSPALSIKLSPNSLVFNQNTL